MARAATTAEKNGSDNGTALVPVRQFSFPMFLERYEAINNLCASLCRARYTGNARTQESVLAKVLQGAELGMPPMTAVANLHDIGGRITMSASLMQGLVMRDAPGTRFRFEESAEACAVTVTRPGHEPYTSRFSMEDAKRAGVVKPDSGWTKYPADMLRARAVARACRTVAPDILCGVYATEEFSDGATLTIAAPAEAPHQSNGHAEPETVIDVEYSTAAPTKPAPAPAAATASPVVSTKVTNAQLLELKRLKETLAIKDQRWLDTIAAFTPAGADRITSARDLSTESADKLIDVLRRRISEDQAMGK